MLPNVPGDCPAGTYTVTFQLTWDVVLLNYYGCAAVDFGGGIFGRASAILACDDTLSPRRWGSVCNFNTDGDCAFANGQCQIGGFLGFNNPFAGTNLHSSRTIDGVCVPTSAEFERVDNDLNISSSYSLTIA